jgi:putative transposase
MLHIMFKFGQCVLKNWRRLRGFDYLAKVITGGEFKDLVEVPDIDQVAASFSRLKADTITLFKGLLAC